MNSFQIRPLLYEGYDAFESLLAPYVTWILLAGALAGAWFIYRASAAGAPDVLAAMLVVAQSAAFSRHHFILLQPVLRDHSVLPQESFVAVAYDVSKSMEIRDGPEGQSRLDVERHLLRSADNPWLAELGKKFKLRFFRFSQSAERVQAFEDTARHGQVTDLERTLDQISGELANVPAAGIVRSRRRGYLPATWTAPHPGSCAQYPHYTAASVPHLSARHRNHGSHNCDKSTREYSHGGRGLGAVKGYAGSGPPLGAGPNRLLQNQGDTLGSDGEVKVYRTTFQQPDSGPGKFKFRVEPSMTRLQGDNDGLSWSKWTTRILKSCTWKANPAGNTRPQARWLQDRNVRLVTLAAQADGKFLRQGIESPATLEKGFPTEGRSCQIKAILLGSVEASFSHSSASDDFDFVAGVEEGS